MRSHKSNRFRNVVLLILVLVVLVPAAGHTQAPPPNRVFFPLVLHGTTCEVVPRWQVIFVEDPGIWYKVSPADPTGYCPVMVYYQKFYTDPDGNNQWGPVTGIQLDVWIWMSRYFSGETRHLIRFTGINYTVGFQ